MRERTIATRLDAAPLDLRHPATLEDTMPEYTDRVTVAAAPDAVFHFVSDIKNLPRYLPTVSGAHPQPGERVAVDGKANGHPYSSDGWFKVDQAGRTMTWGSDGENDYSGKMSVVGEGGGCVVACSLQFNPTGPIKDSMEREQGGPSAAMTDGLRTSLASIKAICEGTGGKHESSAEK